jgi:hypothetical protein
MKVSTTIRNVTLGIMTLSILKLDNIYTSSGHLCECCKQSNYAECHCAECRYTECHGGNVSTQTCYHVIQKINMKPGNTKGEVSLYH